MIIHTPHRTLCCLVLAVFFAAILLPGCATMHVWAADDGDSAENICQDCHATRWAYAWGLVQPQPVGKRDTLCHNMAFSRIRVKTNVGYALITMATFGIAIPQKVEWDCAPQNVPTEDFGQ